MQKKIKDLDENRKAAMVSIGLQWSEMVRTLGIILCSDKDVLPTVTAGTSNQ